MKDLNCLVTGASTGIGKHISIELSKFAKHIYITARNLKKLENVYDKIIQNNCNCTIVPLDLCENSSIENLSLEVFKKDKSLDILISSAGGIFSLSPIDSINLTEFQNILDLNYLANFRLMKNFHPLLKNSKNSHFATISSVNSSKKSHYWGVYQPVMTALNELVRMYANENINTSIKANVFCPSAVDTRVRENIMPGENKQEIKSAKIVAKEIVQVILNTEKNGEIIEL